MLNRALWTQTPEPREWIARRVETGEPVRVVVVGDRIESIQPAWPSLPLESLPYISPGLFDVQVNGHGGTWFSTNALTSDDVLRVLRAFPPAGVTRLLPTLITASHETYCHALRTIDEACRRSDLAASMIAGIHIEGPWISPQDGPRGAHPREHVRAPSLAEWEAWQAAAAGRIRLVTLAPEADPQGEMTRRLVREGVRVAIGHTAATAEQIARAVDAGATLNTHLGNGCSATMHRHHNIFWPQLADDRLTCSLICDGHHLPKEFVNVAYRAKTAQRLILTCDLSGWAGSAPGVYANELGSCECLPDGRLVVAGQRELLAGSAALPDVCLAKFLEMTGAPLAEGIRLFSTNPARALGLPEYPLARGQLADFCLFDWNPAQSHLRIRSTYIAGCCAYLA